MKKENAKIMAEMLCFHIDAAIVVSEHLSDEGNYLDIIKEVLENRATESPSVEQHALWETVKDLFDRPSQLN